MALAATLTSTGQSNPPKYGTEYRTDLQGLRAVAVLSVLFFHASLPFFSGGFVGVDIFFVLSGFLITGIVAKEISASGHFGLVGFYARRVVRIVPAATVVLLLTAIAAYFFIPMTHWGRIAKETIGSALYFSNWQFAATTDYLNAEVIPSPIQHFWSLAVEEQYYILWPALLWLSILALSRRRGAEGRLAQKNSALLSAVLIMSTITVTSFVFSIWSMKIWPAESYFITPARLWELGIGSLIALAVPALRRLPVKLKRVVWGAGIVAVVSTIVIYDNGTAFPGPAAVVPVLGAGALIIGGLQNADGNRIHTVLDARVLVWFGNISYALYLWHWPLLIFAEYILGPLQVYERLAIVALSILPAYLSTRYLEKPLTSRTSFRNHPLRALSLGVAAILVSIASASGLLIAAQVSSTEQDGVSSTQVLGAGALDEDLMPSALENVPAGIVPTIVGAKDDNPALYKDGCHLEEAETVPKVCTYGDPSGPVVLLTGDSHAAQWFPALEQLATQNNFRLVAMTKSSCPFIDVDIRHVSDARTYVACAQWNDEIQKYIAETRPDLVITSNLGSYQVAEDDVDNMSLLDGFTAAWTAATRQGGRLVVIADTPYMRENVPDCLAKNMQTPSECDTPSDEAFSLAGIEQAAIAPVENATLVDLNAKICPGSECTTIIGDVLVYRDQHHLTATYSRSLAPFLEEQVLGALGVE